MKKIFFFLFINITLTSFGQKNDSILSGVYYWNKLEPIKEETRVRRQVLEGKTFALEYFEIHASTLEPGKAPHPPHTHADQEELMIVKEGQVKITIAGQSKILGPGSIAFAMPGDEQRCLNGSRLRCA